MPSLACLCRAPRAAVLVLVLGILATLLSANSHSAPVITIDEAQRPLMLPVFSDWLLGRGDLDVGTLDDVDTALSFAPLKDNALFLPAGTHWMRFTLRNTTSHPQSVWINLRAPDTNLEIYQQGSNTPVTSIRGTQLLDVAVSVAPITLQSNSQTLFFGRLHSSKPGSPHLSVSTTNQFVSLQRRVAYWVASALTTLGIISVFGLLFAWTNRCRLLLFNALIGMSLISYQSSFWGMFAPASDSPSWRQFFVLLSLLGASLASLGFGEAMLREWHLERRVRPVLLGMLALNVITLAIALTLPADQAISLMFIATGASSIASLVFLCIAYFHATDYFALAIISLRGLALVFLLGLGYAVATTLIPVDAGMLVSLFVYAGDNLLVFGVLIRRQQQRSASDIEHARLLAITDAQGRAQADILGRISHDIRTPMSGVLGMTELLLDTPLTPTQRDHVETIQSSGQALLSLISEIHDRSRIDSGRLRIEHLPFDLGLMINECLDAFRNQADDKNVELISHVHADVPVLVVGDSTRLRQILLQLLNNAFKYTEQGEIVLTVSTRYDYRANHVLFAVADTGRGISTIEQKNLFDPDPDTTRGFSSLGLAVARQLIDRMQGDIGVESELGRGTRLWFSVPLPPQVLTRAIEDDIDTSLRSKRMLVVDDNQTCRKVIQQQATAWGMLVSGAHSGNEALAMIRARHNLGESFDIVIADHDMPGMNGLQLCGKISEEFTAEQLPLMIMLTGLSNAPSQAMAREAGIRRVLTKPLTGMALKLTLAEELKFTASPLSTTVITNELLTTPPESQNFNRAHILVAEDNDVSRKVIISMLRKLGADCKTVSNGQQALEALHMESFDLVLMDCEMPVMDGITATREIRRWENATHRPAVPIIALTAHIMDEHKQQSLAAGMNGHLSKPVEIRELNELLKRWTRNLDRTG
jgi:CheY-like chemotaxis protein/signal transduction histidine kinase